MTTLTEGRHAAECVLSEAERGYCREKITILSGEGKLSANQVVGRVAGAVSTVFAGTGDGALTMDALTPKLAGVQEGDYKVACIEPAANGGTFAVFDPNGAMLGSVAVGATFANQIKFSIADGAIDFVAGDAFTVTVAKGTKYRSADPTNTDGSSVARAVLLYDADATSADADVVALVRGPAQVNGNILVYDAAVDDANKKATKVSELGSAGIVVR